MTSTIMHEARMNAEKWPGCVENGVDVAKQVLRNRVSQILVCAPAVSFQRIIFRVDYGSAYRAWRVHAVKSGKTKAPTSLAVDAPLIQPSWSYG
jgi:hypothetical protein